MTPSSSQFDYLLWNLIENFCRINQPEASIKNSSIYELFSIPDLSFAFTMWYRSDAFGPFIGLPHVTSEDMEDVMGEYADPGDINAVSGNCFTDVQKEAVSELFISCLCFTNTLPCILCVTCCKCAAL